MKCYQCVIQADGGTISLKDLNDAVFIINGHSVCGLQDHIDAVIGQPGATSMTITRRQPLDNEALERLRVVDSRADGTA